MASRFKHMWYRDPQFGAAVERAFLYNCRDNDLQPGGEVRKGQIVEGKCGFHVAQSDVPGLSAPARDFMPNRHCDWQNFHLPCQALPCLPAGRVPRSSCRHFHCIVADFSGSPAAQARAAEMGLPLVTVDGRLLANLEAASVPRQGKERIATLL